MLKRAGRSTVRLGILGTILLALSASVSISPAVTSDTPAAARGCAWRVVVAGTKLPRSIVDVAALSPRDVWAVGTSWGRRGTVIAHWDGRRLNLAYPFGRRTRRPELWSVAAISRDDVWAVGFDRDAPLIVHWDGSSWRRARTPRLGSSGRLFDVVALSSIDVWAVGHTGPYNDPHPLVMHWDGRTWTASLPPHAGRLFAIDGAGPRDLWAVGHDNADGRGFRVGPLALHWDGAEWSRVATPDPINPNVASTEVHGAFSGVDAVSATEAWALHFNLGMADVQRWDGTSWRVVRTYTEKALSDIVAVSPRDVWAVGGGRHPLIVHFDGSRWTYATPSPMKKLRTSFWAVSAVSARDIWAAGPRLLARYSC